MRSGTSFEPNIEAMEALIRQAAKKGSVYVLTPEMTGILERDGKALMKKIHPDQADPVFAKAAQLAKELGIFVHIGSNAVRLDEQKAANRGALFDPNGKKIAFYDKIHMFDVALGGGDNWAESKRYQPGDRAVIVDCSDIASDGFKLGMAICYDIRFGELYKALGLAGAQILTCPAAFTVPTGKAHWHVLLRARAIENGAFVIAAAQGGRHEDGRATYGHSLIVSPWGEIIAELDHDEPGVLTADIDLDAVETARRRIPNLANNAGFTISQR